jgi:hypothetical protein
MRLVLSAAVVAALLSPAAGQTQPQPEQQRQPETAPQTKEIVIGTVPNVAPEYQEAARKAQRARQKIAICQKQASEQKILPRYRTEYVLACIDQQAD